LRLLPGMLLVGPNQAGPGTCTFRVDLEGPFEVSDTGLRLCNGCQDQPGFLDVRSQRGGNLRPGAGCMFIATMQGIDGPIQGLAGLNGLAGHGNFFSDNSLRILLRLLKITQQYFYGNCLW
jgi:hypothetical protein